MEVELAHAFPPRPREDVPRAILRGTVLGFAAVAIAFWTADHTPSQSYRIAAAAPAAAELPAVASSPPNAATSSTAAGTESLSTSSTAWPGDGRVRLRMSHVSVATDGTLTVEVDTRLTRPTEYFEVRLRLRRPSGDLIYQKTEVRHNVGPGIVTIAYTRGLAELDAEEGRHPIEVRVLASGEDQVNLDGRALVIDPSRSPAKLVLIARLSCTPALAPDGRFAVDPASDPHVRDQALGLTRLASRLEPGSRISVALPPVLLDEWRRAGDGYDVVISPDEVRAVGPDDEVPASIRRLLSELRGLVTSGRVEVLDVPYAEPDMFGLQQMEAVDDLARHYRLGHSTYAAALDATPSAGTILASGALPADAADVLVERGIRFAVVNPSSVRVGRRRATPGVYRVQQGRLALVADPEAGVELTDAATGSNLIAERLFSTRTKGQTRPVVAIVDLGVEPAADAEQLATTLGRLTEPGWVDLVSASSIAIAKGAKGAALVDRVPTDKRAPSGHWNAVASARTKALGLFAALGENDELAERSLLQLLMAESRCWAGDDGRWRLAGRSRSFSTAIDSEAQAVFSKVALAAKDLTLSSSRGSLPVSVTNRSGHALAVTVRADAERLRFPAGSERGLTLGRDETYVTLPVNLGSSLADRVTLTLRAGTLTIATSSVVVRGSYLDRVAMIVGVVVILAGLLFFIRRRTRSSEEEEPNEPSRAYDEPAGGTSPDAERRDDI